MSRIDPYTAYQRKVEASEIRFDPEQEKAVEALQRVAQDLDQRKPRNPGRRLFRWGAGPAAPTRGLYLHGDAGRGKSMLMDLFFDTVTLSPKRRVHFHGFMAEVHAGIARARSGSCTDPIVPVAEAIARDAALLCFDEMQITDITDAMLVGRLFERLFGLGVVVVTTSNRPPDALYDGGWNRDQFLPFIELLKQHLRVHELAGPVDHRRNRASQTATYIAPLGPEAEAAVDAAWRDLVGSHREVPLRLRVQGRDLVFPRSVGRALRCDFEHLCGGPSGARDYLALAEAVDVLIVENVPQLSARRSNAAWRFVTLIDALYEARVKLVISAATEPDDLYTDGEGAFEFARTASRLLEMQSVEWWRAT